MNRNRLPQNAEFDPSVQLAFKNVARNDREKSRLLVRVTVPQAGGLHGPRRSPVVPLGPCPFPGLVHAKRACV